MSWLNTEDQHGPVCVNMDTGLRFRPDHAAISGLESGVKIIFPDGSTSINVRSTYGRLTDILKAISTK